MPTEHEARSEIFCYGVLDNLPKLESTAVRLYFNSSLSDMTAERNYLVKNCVPRMREYFLEKGLDFQVVSWNWEDEDTIETAVKEIQFCEKSSKGPYFVMFLGDKYGCSFLPKQIEATEYRTLYRIAEKLESETILLNKWYSRDDNAEPAVFYLQPITDVLPNYNTSDPEKNALKLKDQKEWSKVKEKLSNCLQTVANRALQEGKISEKDHLKYFYSASEVEGIHGILESKTLKNRVLAYYRTFEKVDLGEAIAKDFTDVMEDTCRLDSERKELGEILKYSKVQKLVPADQMKRFTLYWLPGGIDPANQDHKEYLECLSQHFEENVIKMVEKTFKKNHHDDEDLYNEVVNHLHFAKKMLQCYCDRDELLESIREKMIYCHSDEADTKVKDSSEGHQSNRNDGNTGVSMAENCYGEDFRNQVMHKFSWFKEQGVRYIHGDTDCDTDPDQKPPLITISSDNYCQPVVLHGESGSGKSSLMAKVVEAAQSWFPGCFTIARFVGVSVESCSLRGLLTSIITHICRITNKPVPLFGNDIMSLSDLFEMMLRSISPPQKRVLVLDAVDHLTDNDQAHLLKWLPCKLPTNIHLIVSMATKPTECLENMKSRAISDEHFIDIGYLDENTAEGIITKMSHQQHRRVVPPQKHQLLELFAKCQKPLYLKILTDQALGWKSTRDVTQFKVKPNIQAAITVFFDYLEKKNGIVLVEKFFGYLMASREGLSWAEMEDVLSLDDEVVMETSQCRLPADIHYVRVNSLGLSRLLLQTTKYMDLKLSGGKHVMGWNHRHLAEVARKRYLPSGRQEHLYQTLMDYFRGAWYNTRKPLEIVLSSKTVATSTNRQMPPQPLYYTDTVCNRRKLIELPFHILKAKQFQCFCEEICHYEWLFAKCQFISVGSVIEDLTLALSEMEKESTSAELCRTVDIVRTVMIRGEQDISRDTTHLAVQILGQLGQSYRGNSALENLVKETIEWSDDYTAPTLIPQTQCLPSPDSYCWCIIKTDIDHDFNKIMHVNEGRQTLLILNTRLNSLTTFDLAKQGSLVSVEKSSHIDTKSVQFYDEQKLAVLLCDNGEERVDCLVRSNNLNPVVLPADPRCVAVSSKYVIFDSDNMIYVCALGTNQSAMSVVCTVRLDDDERIQHLVISPDNQYLLVFNVGSIYVLDNVPKLRLHHKINTKEAKDYCYQSLVHVLENNLLFYRGTKDERCVHVHDLESTEERYVINFSERHAPTVFSVHPSRKYIGIGYEGKDQQTTDHSWFLYDTRDGMKLSHSPEAGGISHLQLFGSEFIFAIVAPIHTHSDNLTVFYGGNVDNPLPCMLPFQSLIGHHQQITQMIISHDESTLYTAAGDCTVRVWRLGRLVQDFINQQLSGILLQKDEVMESYRQQMATTPTTLGLKISRDNKLVYLGQSDGGFMVKDMATGNTIHHQNLGQRIKYLLTRKSGGDIILIDMADVVTVLDVNTYKIRRKLKVGFDVTGAAETNGLLVVCRQENHKPSHAKVYNIRNGALIKEIEKLGTFSQVTLNSMGTKIVTDLKGFPLIIPVQKDVKSDDLYLRAALECHDYTPSICTAVGVRPDDRYAFAATNDGSLRVITMSGEFIMKCETKSKITAAMFSPDGKYIISAGYKTIYGWSVNQGVLSFKLTKHDDIIEDIRFNQSGRYMLTVSRDKTLILWDVLRRRSLASFVSHDPVSLIDLSDDARNVAFYTKIVLDVGLLKVNKILQSMVEGKRRQRITPSMVDAQALALSFSSQKMKKREATRIGCQIM